MDKINLKKSDKYVALSNLYYTWKNMQMSYKNDKFEILAPTWNEKFELPDGSYSLNISLKNMRQLLIILQKWYT